VFVQEDISVTSVRYQKRGILQWVFSSKTAGN